MAHRLDPSPQNCGFHGGELGQWWAAAKPWGFCCGGGGTLPKLCSGEAPAASVKGELSLVPCHNQAPRPSIKESSACTEPQLGHDGRRWVLVPTFLRPELGHSSPYWIKLLIPKKDHWYGLLWPYLAAEATHLSCLVCWNFSSTYKNGNLPIDICQARV